jgi:hypothetical protein
MSISSVSLLYIQQFSILSFYNNILYDKYEDLLNFPQNFAAGRRAKVSLPLKSRLWISSRARLPFVYLYDIVDSIP